MHSTLFTSICFVKLLIQKDAYKNIEFMPLKNKYSHNYYDLDHLAPSYSED